MYSILLLERIICFGFSKLISMNLCNTNPISPIIIKGIGNIVYWRYYVKSLYIVDGYDDEKPENIRVKIDLIHDDAYSLQYLYGGLHYVVCLNMNKENYAHYELLSDYINNPITFREKVWFYISKRFKRFEKFLNNL